MTQNKQLHIEVGHTEIEWQSKYGNNNDLWDFNIEDIENGAIEANPDIWYWLIGNRLYETDIPFES